MVEDGKVYVFHPKCALSKCLDVDSGQKENGTNLLIWDYHRSNNQRFQAISAGNGYFIFKNLKSETIIDVYNSEVKNGTNIQMWESNNSDNQKWKIINEGDGYYSIQSKLNSNYYLDVQFSGTQNGTNVWLYEGNNSDAQKFRIVQKELYRYRIGVKDLFDNENLGKAHFTHAAFLIGTDLFEYGTNRYALVGSGINYSGNFINPFITNNVAQFIEKNSTIKNDLYNQGYVRRNCGRDPSFDWEKIGNQINGTTWTQPYELEQCIIKDGTWRNIDYDLFKHNCHDFVSFCLYICGANDVTYRKFIPVFKPH